MKKGNRYQLSSKPCLVVVMSYFFSRCGDFRNGTQVVLLIESTLVTILLELQMDAGL